MSHHKLSKILFFIVLSIIFIFTSIYFSKIFLFQKTKREFENFSQEVKYFNANDFLWGGRYEPIFYKEYEGYARFVKALSRKNYSSIHLIKLLKHQDPKVRVLTMAARYAKQDPQLLPEIFTLINDAEPAFQFPQPLRNENVSANPPLNTQR